MQVCARSPTAPIGDPVPTSLRQPAPISADLGLVRWKKLLTQITLHRVQRQTGGLGELPYRPIDNGFNRIQGFQLVLAGTVLDPVPTSLRQPAPIAADLGLVRWKKLLTQITLHRVQRQTGGLGELPYRPIANHGSHYTPLRVVYTPLRVYSCVMARHTTLLVDAGQLDLFAEIETAEVEERLASAPCLYASTARGFFARLAAWTQWIDEYGNFDCIRLSHGWHTWYRDQQPTHQCRPIVMSADLRCNCYEYGCQCVGELIYRGACLHCDFEGPDRLSENEAAEDANDHCWHGWRDLPIVPPAPEGGTSKKDNQARSTWVSKVNELYPAGWLEDGGPIRTRRSGLGTRHVPARTPFGGYDMCGEIDSAT
jgi:hypothetical protein